MIPSKVLFLVLKLFIIVLVKVFPGITLNKVREETSSKTLSRVVVEIYTRLLMHTQYILRISMSYQNVENLVLWLAIPIIKMKPSWLLWKAHHKMWNANWWFCLREKKVSCYGRGLPLLINAHNFCIFSIPSTTRDTCANYVLGNLLAQNDEFNNLESETSRPGVRNKDNSTVDAFHKVDFE